jgi:hypothetical protein
MDLIQLLNPSGMAELPQPLRMISKTWVARKSDWKLEAGFGGLKKARSSDLDGYA